MCIHKYIYHCLPSKYLLYYIELYVDFSLQHVLTVYYTPVPNIRKNQKIHIFLLSLLEFTLYLKTRVSNYKWSPYICMDAVIFLKVKLAIIL